MDRQELEAKARQILLTNLNQRTHGLILVERFDEDEAVGALVKLVNDEDYRNRLAEDARDYALSEFTWPAVAEKYLGVYSATET